MIPTDIQLLQKRRVLVVTFDSGERFELPCSYLRENSLSAENRKQEVSPDAYKDVNIISVEPVGNYAVKLIFDDGHSTGLYSWETLYKLGKLL